MGTTLTNPGTSAPLDLSGWSPVAAAPDAGSAPEPMDLTGWAPVSAPAAPLKPAPTEAQRQYAPDIPKPGLPPYSAQPNPGVDPFAHEQVARNAAKQNLLESPVTGAMEAAGGVKQIARAQSLPQAAAGAHQVLAGGAKALTLPMIAAGGAAPMATLRTLAAAWAAQTGTTAGLQHFGVAPEYADLAGDIAGIVAGYGVHWATAPKDVHALVDAVNEKGTGADDLVDKLHRMAAQTESPNEAKVAREILRRKYGVDIKEPEQAAQPEQAAPEPAPQTTTAPAAHPPTPIDVSDWVVEHDAPAPAPEPARFDVGQSVTLGQHKGTVVGHEGGKVVVERVTPGGVTVRSKVLPEALGVHVDAPAPAEAPVAEATASEVAPPEPQPDAAPLDLTNWTPEPTTHTEAPAIEGAEKLRDAYDAFQHKIDAKETELEKNGVDVGKLYDKSDPGWAFLNGRDPDGMTPMPKDLADLYKGRDAIQKRADKHLDEGLYEQLADVVPNTDARRKLVKILSETEFAPSTRGAYGSNSWQDIGRIANEVLRFARKEAGDTDSFTEVRSMLAGTPENPGNQLVLKANHGTTPYPRAAVFDRAQQIFDAVIGENAPKLPRPGKPSGARSLAAAEGAPRLEAPTPHKFSSTQVNLPPALHEAFTEATHAIQDADLSEEGRETKPRITALYGLHAEEPSAVEDILKGESPITATLGKISVFKSDESDGQDVVKIDVDSPDLHLVNADLANLPNGNTHPEYHPHVTLAYVKPGEGEKYVGQDAPGLTGKTVTFDAVTFSGKDRTKTEIPLEGKKAAAGPREPHELTAAEYIGSGETPASSLSRLGLPQLKAKAEADGISLDAYPELTSPKGVPERQVVLAKNRLARAISHKGLVRDALRRGEAVPDGALAEYGDLGQAKAEPAVTPQPKLAHWLNSLTPEEKESVLSAMREIRDEADRANDQHRDLSPRNGDLPVGGAHMDPFFRSEALNGFLRGLSNGDPLWKSVEAGNKDANFAIRKWNESRKDYQVHRAMDMEQPHLDALAMRVAGAANGEKVTATNITSPAALHSRTIEGPADKDVPRPLLDLIAESRGRYEEIAGRPVVLLNSQAMRALHRAIGYSDEEAIGINGYVLHPQDQQLTLIGLANMGKAAGDNAPALKASEDLTREFRAALAHARHSGGVAMVLGDPHYKSVNQIDTIIREELNHLDQQELGAPHLGRGAQDDFFTDVAAQTAYNRLVRAGYDLNGPNGYDTAIMEIGVRLAQPERYKELGIGEEDAQRLRSKYAELLKASHGDRAERLIERITSAASPTDTAKPAGGGSASDSAPPSWKLFNRTAKAGDSGSELAHAGSAPDSGSEPQVPGLNGSEAENLATLYGNQLTRQDKAGAAPLVGRITSALAPSGEPGGQGTQGQGARAEEHGADKGSLPDWRRFSREKGVVETGGEEELGAVHSGPGRQNSDAHEFQGPPEAGGNGGNAEALPDPPRGHERGGGQQNGAVAGKLSPKAGQSPALNEFVHWLASLGKSTEDPEATTEPTAEPTGQRHHDRLSALKRLILPGRNLQEIRAASLDVYRAAVRAGSAASQSAAIMHNAIPQIRKALAESGADITVQDLFGAYQESRLRAISDRYQRWADAVSGMDDKETEHAFRVAGPGGHSTLLQMMEQFDRLVPGTETPTPFSPTQTALAAAERGDWGEIRDMASGLFDNAADSVNHTLTPERYDAIKNAIANNPKVRQADDLYGNLVESEISDAHANHEGVFAEDLGDLNHYFPLLVEGKESNRMSAGRRTPYGASKNRNNHFATGISRSGYVTDLPKLAQFLSTSLRASGKANLLKIIDHHGWSAPEPKGWNGIFEGPDGVEYQGVKEESRQGRTLILNGKTVPIGGQSIIMPLFLKEGLSLILENKPANPEDVVRAARWLNNLATKGPFELAFHSAGMLGTLYGNTPFIAGHSAIDRAMSAPIIKWFQIRGKVLTTDPSTPENAAKLIRIAKVGALPARSHTVTRSREVARDTGAELERWSFAPLLYGPKGFDARARIMMYDLAMASDPHMSDVELGDFINQLGNYTPEFQGIIERHLKRIGIGPFATAGMTRELNGFQAATGTGPMPKRGSLAANIAQRVAMSILGAGAMYLLAYKALTGKWPSEDDRFKMWKFPVGGGDGFLDQHRHSWLGDLTWGDGNEVGYLDFSAIGAPLIKRITPNTAINRYMHGGSAEQVLYGAGADLGNLALHPALGPFAHAAFAVALGQEPYITDLADSSGKSGLQLFPATPSHLKPGFIGGLAPRFSDEEPTNHPGFPSRVGARTAAAVKDLNSFVGTGGELFSVLGADEKAGSLLFRMAMSLLSPFGGSVFSGASDPDAQERRLMRQKRALEER